MRTSLIALCLVALAAAASGQTMLNGAGATFPYPIYSKWFDEFHKLHPDVQINYQAIGSGGGIRQLEAGTVDFGASDQPMTDEQLKKQKTGVLHFPTVAGAVVPTYNVAGAARDLNFTPEALAGVFLGKVKKWNAPEIAKANPGAKLPDAEIVVVHRSDGSGTTFIWTDFLSKTSPEWKSTVGSGTAINWPVGLGAKGNEGVAGLVKQTPNSVGYVELIYAIQNDMAYGRVRNAAGKFVKPDLATVTAAAAATAAKMPDDFRVSITNVEGKDAYPISSFTWLLVPDRIADARKKAVIVEMLKWALGPGQKMTAALHYAPLPANVVSKELKAISKIQ